MKFIFFQIITFMSIGTNLMMMIYSNSFLPLENIEIIQRINKSRNNLLNLSIDSIFKEYTNKKYSISVN